MRSVEKKACNVDIFLSHFPCLRSIHRPFKVWRRYDHYALKAYWKRTKLKDKETSQWHDKKGQRTLFVNDVKTRKKYVFCCLSDVSSIAKLSCYYDIGQTCITAKHYNRKPFTGQDKYFCYFIGWLWLA